MRSSKTAKDELHQVRLAPRNLAAVTVSGHGWHATPGGPLRQWLLRFRDLILLSAIFSQEAAVGEQFAADARDQAYQMTAFGIALADRE